MKLTGSISPSIGNLTFLREITLSANSLKGGIPPEFGQLKRLQFLNLTVNHLQGHIPIELTNSSTLQVIFLSRNNLSGEIPYQFGYMSQLMGLSLGGNNFVGSIPSSLGNLSSLEYLSLAYNNLWGSIPHALGSASSLNTLFLGVNGLSGLIPLSIYNLSSMGWLDVSSNHFSGSLPHNIDLIFPNLQLLVVADNQFTGVIPAAVSNISSLFLLDMLGNNFSGSVPETLGKLKNLQELLIGYNSLGSAKAGDFNFLSSLSNCTKLELLAIHGNRFGGVLPDAVGNLSSQLKMLFMGRNHISGNIPEAIGNLVGLTLLDMGINFLTGTIPVSVGKLRNIGRLFFHRNNLHGKVPSFFGNFSRLFDLYLHDNNFEGSIPISLKNCTEMQNLFLHKNNFSGSLPNQMFASLQNLITIYIFYNFLTGPLPSDIGSLSNLVVLDVSENKLSGEIPMDLGSCSGLRELSMAGNFFQGTIPLSFRFLKSLESLDLSRNNLSGRIPHQLDDLSYLMKLNLSFNFLEGEVPLGGVFGNVTGFSMMGNNMLCGGVPKLNLPACLNKKLKRKGNIQSVKVIVPITISILVASTLMMVLFILWRKRNSREKSLFASLLDAGHLRLSYKELLQATGGFASSSLIGTGSFGSVYKGFLHPLEKLVAVKVLKLQNRGASKSFKAECKTLGKVRHRNLLKIITSCSSLDYNGRDFKALVFEFMSNGNLDSWLHQNEEQESRKLNLMQRLDIAIDVAYALDYLHYRCEPPIVHCDLKPSNVLLDDDMVAHVGDFGLAKLLSLATDDFSRDQTSSSVIKGTIGYVAPEYGIGGTVSPEGDIYSYGILLLEMITAKRPTDDVFPEGFSLHNTCKRASPENVRDIVDSYLLQQSVEGSDSISNQHGMNGQMWECLVSFLRIGVSCSAELPSERMNIKDVIKELCAAKNMLLQAGKRGRVRNYKH
eukprot:XP_015579471.2 putative receptor-like protein kinase At3g47110 [Ricinus communis]